MWGRIIGNAQELYELLPPNLAIVFFGFGGVITIMFIVAYTKSFVANINIDFGGRRHITYFMGPCYKQAFYIFMDTAGSLVNRTEFGISSLICTFGDYEDDSSIKLFFLSIIYVPLVIIGSVEYVLRIPLGLVGVSLLTILHTLVGLIGTSINLFLMLILRIVEVFTQK